MPFDYSIRIRGAKGTTAQFVPQGGSPGSALTVTANDTVSWGNESGDAHQPWPTDANHTLFPDPPVPSLSNPIPADQSSSPAWVVVGAAGTTLYYRCKLHPTLPEYGQILIT